MHYPVGGRSHSIRLPDGMTNRYLFGETLSKLEYRTSGAETPPRGQEESSQTEGRAGPSKRFPWAERIKPIRMTDRVVQQCCPVSGTAKPIRMTDRKGCRSAARCVVESTPSKCQPRGASRSCPVCGTGKQIVMPDGGASKPCTVAEQSSTSQSKWQTGRGYQGAAP